jgi:DNA-directed RNA polymerase subunit RPC12/RpoP
MDLAELEKRIVKDCPKCNSRVKFQIGDKTAKCVKCKRKFEIVRDETKDEKDPEAYSFVYNASIVDVIGKISLGIMIGASILMLVFALYAKHKMVDGVEENTGGYTLRN